MTTPSLSSVNDGLRAKPAAKPAVTVPENEVVGLEAVLVKMRSILPELRPSEQRVAMLFLQDPAATARLSITEVAKRCNTSTTSVVRFTKRLGYTHYNNLRMDVTRDVTRETFESGSGPDAAGDINRDDSLEEIVAKVSYSESRSIADTVLVLNIDSLEKAVSAVATASRVDIFGVGASSIVGLDLQLKLIRIGQTSLTWSDTHAAITAAATLNADCVAIGVSHSGGTADTVEYLAAARKRNATTIAITNHWASPITRYSDIVLLTAARETQFRSGALGSRIAQLLVIDCLFIGVARASYDRSVTAVADTYSAIQEMQTNFSRAQTTTSD